MSEGDGFAATMARDEPVAELATAGGARATSDRAG